MLVIAAVVPPLLQLYEGEPALLVTVAEPLLPLHEVDVEEMFSTRLFDADTVTLAIEAQLLLSCTVTV